MTDAAKFTATVDAIAGLDLTTVVGGHMAPLHGPRLRDAMTILRALPTAATPPLPGQPDLDAILLAATAA